MRASIISCGRVGLNLGVHKGVCLGVLGRRVCDGKGFVVVVGLLSLLVVVVVGCAGIDSFCGVGGFINSFLRTFTG